MRRPALSLKALRAFVTVVDLKSMSAAARKLNVAVSAVSAAVDQVEAEIGARLLIRARARGVAPTPEAMRLAAQFRELLEDYARILDGGRSVARELSGTLRIGYYAPVAPAFLPRLLAPLVEASPRLEISLGEYNNESAQTALLAGELDVILFTGRDLRPGIETRHLMALPPYVLASADHPLTGQATVAMADLEALPVVLLDLPVARSYLHGLFAGHGIAPRIVARANTTEMVRSLVGEGLGIAVLNMRPRTPLSYGGNALAVLPLKVDAAPIDLQAGIATTQPRHVVSVFLDALTDWARSPDIENVRVAARD